MSISDQPPSDTLAALYGPLVAKAAASRALCGARVQVLDEAIREASMWSSRRAAGHARDRSCYRLGGALKPAGGLAIDDVALSGLDALGAHGVALLAVQALVSPDGASLSDLILAISRGKAGQGLRAWGVWARFNWLKALYEREVTEFENGPAGRDKARSWRRKPVRAGQAYLIRELARFLQLEQPEPGDRGAGHDWLLLQGGNPRFLAPHEQPPLPALSDLLS